MKNKRDKLTARYSRILSVLIDEARSEPTNTDLAITALRLFTAADDNNLHLSNSVYMSLFGIMSGWNDKDTPLVNILTLSCEPLVLLMLEHMAEEVLGG